MAALSARRVDPFDLLMDYGIWAALGIAILTAAASAPRFLSVANVHDLMSAMARELVEKAGGQVAGCVFLVELTFLDGRDKLKPYEVFSLIQY